MLAAVLVAGLLAIGAGKLSGLFYSEGEAEKRGFEIEVAETSVTGADAPKEEVIDIAALMATASAEKGQKIAKRCVSCHKFEKGGKNKVGPALWNIVGAPKGKIPGYKYSAALLEKGGDWNYESLFAFFKKPKNYIPGTKMNFAGLKKPTDVANLIAYMRQNSDVPFPLPEAKLDIPEEEAEVSIIEEKVQEAVEASSSL